MKTSHDPRHLARQKTVQQLFAYQAQKLTLSSKDHQFKNMGETTKAIVELLPALDSFIQEAAPEWSTEKINQIDLAILRLAVYELVFDRTQPPKAIIDEAVELAKEFGGDTSPNFINGALGKILLSPRRLNKIIADKLGVEESKILPQSSFKADFNVTDLEIADLISQIEKDLSITLSPTAISTVSDIYNLVSDEL